MLAKRYYVVDGRSVARDDFLHRGLVHDVVDFATAEVEAGCQRVRVGFAERREFVAPDIGLPFCASLVSLVPSF